KRTPVRQRIADKSSVDPCRSVFGALALDHQIGLIVLIIGVTTFITKKWKSTPPQIVTRYSVNEGGNDTGGGATQTSPIVQKRHPLGIESFSDNSRNENGFPSRQPASQPAGR